MRDKMYCILSGDEEGNDFLSEEMSFEDSLKKLKEDKQRGSHGRLIEVTRKPFDLDDYKKGVERELAAKQKELDLLTNQ